MGKAALKEPRRKRTASKEERQQQLILATIRSVAKNGLSDTTMATVSREAGLSQGIINLHFQSKDRLLVETLRYIADEYRESWEKEMARDNLSSAEKLQALVFMDFKQPVCDPNKLAVWFAFWGETKSRPTYRKICSTVDQMYRKQMIELCEDLIRQGGYEHLDAATVATGLSAMTSGLWLDILTNPRSTTRRQARSVCMAYLEASFPGFYPVAESEAVA